MNTTSDVISVHDIVKTLCKPNLVDIHFSNAVFRH